MSYDCQQVLDVLIVPERTSYMPRGRRDMCIKVSEHTGSRQRDTQVYLVVPKYSEYCHSFRRSPADQERALRLCAQAVEL